MREYWVTSVRGDSATLQTDAHQAPLSVEFPRQEYWPGLPCPNTSQAALPLVLTSSRWSCESSRWTSFPSSEVKEIRESLSQSWQDRVLGSRWRSSPSPALSVSRCWEAWQPPLLRRYLAEWMVHGYPSENVWELDLKRFGALQSSRTFLRHRVMEVMREWSCVPSAPLCPRLTGSVSTGQSPPRLFSNRVKLGFWYLPVSGLCGGHHAPWHVWTVLFSVLCRTYLRDQKVDWDARGSLLSDS